MDYPRPFVPRTIYAHASQALEPSPANRRLRRAILVLLVAWVQVFLIYSFVSNLQKAAAKEQLTFATSLTRRTIKIPYPAAQSIELPGQPAYKVERLNYYRDLLAARGITNERHLRLLAAQLFVENGAISENVHGDRGCSVGIPQRNVCLFGYSAKSFLRKYPAWNDWRVQMEWLAGHTAAGYNQFKGDVRLTIIRHNCPACAARGTDTPAGYYRKVTKMADTLL